MAKAVFTSTVPNSGFVKIPDQMREMLLAQPEDEMLFQIEAKSAGNGTVVLKQSELLIRFNNLIAQAEST